MAKKRKAPARAKRKAAPIARKKIIGKAKRKAAPIAKAKAVSNVKKKAAPSSKQQVASQASISPVPQTRTRAAPLTMYGIMHPGMDLESDPSFRDAPEDWTPARARALAAKADLKLTEDHWEVIRVLQGCYKDEVSPRLRLLHDALEARFGGKGGMRYLFGILPGGPIVQGCTLAGLKPPAGATDVSYGSVA
jgi:tRNA 2-thiouridine synthesizing protein E